MAKFYNPAPGARGISLKSGVTLLVEAGATAEVDDGDIARVHPDLVEGDGPSAVAGQVADDHQAAIDLLKGQHDDEIAALTNRAVTAENALAEANDEIAALKEAAATVSAKLPGLTGKAKPALLEIAAAEGVTEFTGDDGVAKPIAEGTNNDIVAAIEAKREPAAS
jgi:hypothetical protein